MAQAHEVVYPRFVYFALRFVVRSNLVADMPACPFKSICKGSFKRPFKIIQIQTRLNKAYSNPNGVEQSLFKSKRGWIGPIQIQTGLNASRAPPHVIVLLDFGIVLGHFGIVLGPPWGFVK